MASDDQVASAVTAIHGGDLDKLAAVLRSDPELARGRVDGQRTLLHVATDYPGNFPNSAETVKLLIASGADVNATFFGRHSETPLHWAASCNDVAALNALLDADANIDATGAVIAGGTPLADAVAFGQWDAARALVERGASVNLWQAAALGLGDRVEAQFASDPPPSPEQVTQAFWCACHGGQLRMAEYLAARGADVEWVGYDNLRPIEAARRSNAPDVVEWLERVISSDRV